MADEAAESFWLTCFFFFAGEKLIKYMFCDVLCVFLNYSQCL